MKLNQTDISIGSELISFLVSSLQKANVVSVPLGAAITDITATLAAFLLSKYEPTAVQPPASPAAISPEEPTGTPSQS